MIFLDVDGFKSINDTLGHAAGDLLLQSIAARLSGCVRKSDTVSRHGGDEFVIVSADIAHAEDASIVAKKILHAAAGPHRIDGQDLRITASVGVAIPYDGQDADTLLKNADTAMYYAKRAGHDNYQRFHSDMTVRDGERRSLEGALRRALARGEFELHYQPTSLANS